MAPRGAKRGLHIAFLATDSAARPIQTAARAARGEVLEMLQWPPRHRRSQGSYYEQPAEADDSESDEVNMYEGEDILKEREGNCYVKWACYDSGGNMGV
ncbi:hypothetical protein PI125_g14883 [Phytophthora idaei]|nr:hypothetical protein PI125_g14883 [Phytophthora idaei]KAG3144827.1 hypothetical protein PI126_g13986 [Phytophthora idaei]